MKSNQIRQALDVPRDKCLYCKQDISEKLKTRKRTQFCSQFERQQMTRLLTIQTNKGVCDYDMLVVKRLIKTGVREKEIILVE